MRIDGSCHCGEITFEAELDPAKVGICHCTDCQRLSASAFRTLAMVRGDTFRLTGGTPKHYVKTADSGNRRVQAFCGTCGSAIFASDDSEAPAVVNLRMGVINQRNDLTPVFECWRRSAADWLPACEDTRLFDANPEL